MESTQAPTEQEIQPVFYRQDPSDWDKEQSDIIEKILRYKYNNYEEDTDRRRVIVAT